MVEPRDLDKNNNNLEEAEIHTSQPHHASLPPPEATSTPRPQSPTGIINDQYSDSLSSENEAHAGRPGAALSSGHDSGLAEVGRQESRGLPGPGPWHGARVPGRRRIASQGQGQVGDL